MMSPFSYSRRHPHPPGPPRPAVEDQDLLRPLATAAGRSCHRQPGPALLRLGAQRYLARRARLGCDRRVVRLAGLHRVLHRDPCGAARGTHVRETCLVPGALGSADSEEGAGLATSAAICIPAAHEATGLRATSHVIALRLRETLRILGFLILVLYKLSEHATARESIHRARDALS